MKNKELKILAIIPGRGGSKGIPLKNIQKLGKLPPRTNLDSWIYNEVLDDIETDIKYAGYIKRHEIEINKLFKNESVRISTDVNYYSFAGLSNEAKEKLTIVRPETFGQASRISGVSPADISALMVYLLPKT